MEILNIIALLLIASSNVFIGIKVRNQKTINTNNIVLPEIKPFETPTIVVQSNPSALNFDYEKFGAAIKKAILESQVALHNAEVVLPVVIPNTTPIPGTPSPLLVTAQNSNYYFDGHTLATDVEIEGVPAKQFPRTG